MVHHSWTFALHRGVERRRAERNVQQQRRRGAVAGGRETDQA
jgi:hypothetical protein